MSSRSISPSSISEEMLVSSEAGGRNWRSSSSHLPRRHSSSTSCRYSDLSRIDSGNLRLQKTTLDLAEVVEASTALVASDAAKRGIEPGGVVSRRAQRAEPAALKFGQHMVEPLRRFVARHEAAAEHLVPALVQPVQRVVNRQHRPE